MEIKLRSKGVRGISKVEDSCIFDGFIIFYNDGNYSTTLNVNTLEFFEHIKRVR